MSDGRTYHDRLSCHDRHKTGPLTFQILSVKALDQRPYRKKGLWSEREQKFSLDFQNGNLKSWVVSVDPRNRLSILSSKVNNTKPSLSRPPAWSLSPTNTWGAAPRIREHSGTQAIQLLCEKGAPGHITPRVFNRRRGTTCRHFLPWPQRVFFAKQHVIPWLFNTQVQHQEC